MLGIKTGIWSIPMGFETMYNVYTNCAKNTIWSIPMGFETNILDLFWQIIKNLKYPYGIWNFCPLFRSLFLLNLKYPYGIWNEELSTQKQTEIEFEVSLWDLKLDAHCISKTYITIWSIPMGFETCSFDFFFQIFIIIWSIPMGFETCIKQSKGRCSPIWSIPMGFETYDWRRCRKDCYRIWSIPMGFETR